jgi:hypothetical protein
VANDKMDPDALADRAGRNDMGFMSAANVGWIELGTETITRPRHIERSVYQGAHSEELLVAWAIAQGADLRLAPNAPGDRLRVKRLYTERAPCSLADNRDGADPARYARAATDRSCQTYLHRVLHAEVEVIHSVDNAPAPHERLRHEEWVKFRRRRELARVRQVYVAKRAIVGGVPAFINLYGGHVATIAALQPASLSTLDVGNYRVAVAQAANTAIAALQAWQPPVAVVAPLGPPPGPPPGPPGPPGPASGDKRGASGDPDPDPDAPGPAAKRAQIGVP